MFDYIDLGYGVKLVAPNGEEVFLQGDDASSFMDEVTQLDEVWENNNWQSPNPECFPTYESHLSVLIDPYF